jgi:DNA replication licensing factor MCM5
MKKLSAKNSMNGVSIPSKCDRGGQEGEDCGPNPFVIMADQCTYIDQQTLKLQESPEVVPTGEMPRHILLSIDRYLVDRVNPGMRVSVLGIVSLFQQQANNGGANKNAGTAAGMIRTPYLRVLGMALENVIGSGPTTSSVSGSSSSAAAAATNSTSVTATGTSAMGGNSVSSSHGMTFTPAEEEEFQMLARDPFIYDRLARSIAPQISGDYTVDIKKALVCLLLGGSRKLLPDGVRLRGDINILLMGDPSTAKSQFLKFIEKVSPIGVYTSGKGSSAAGLTASVIKDSKGEFFLEGGAMVLADGGVICIDEVSSFQVYQQIALMTLP